MKKQTVTIILIFLISFAFAGSKGSDWAAKIDGKKISMKDFNKYYYIQNKTMQNVNTNEEVDALAKEAEALPPQQLNQLQKMLIKQNFLDQLIAQKLIYNKAYSDSSINKEEMDAILELTKMQTITSYYLAQKLKDKIQATDEEVEEFYNMHRQHFRGIPLNQEVMDRIKQQIVMEKSQVEADIYLRNLLDEAIVDRKGLVNALKAGNDKKEKEEKEEKKVPKEGEEVSEPNKEKQGETKTESNR
jgi:hypothetical protein